MSGFTKDFFKNIDEDSHTGYIFGVDKKYPEQFGMPHKGLSFLLEKLTNQYT